MNSEGNNSSILASASGMNEEEGEASLLRKRIRSNVEDCLEFNDRLVLQRKRMISHFKKQYDQVETVMKTRKFPDAPPFF
jgi:hypothetical protein